MAALGTSTRGIPICCRSPASVSARSASSSDVTLRCVPAFELHCTETPIVFEQMVEAWDDAVAAHDHFEFWWVPSTEWVLTKANLRDGSSKPGWDPPMEDRIIGRRALTILGLLGRWQPEGDRPHSVQFSDRSDRIFCSPRETPFYEMEYAIPAEHGMHALQRFAADRERTTGASASRSRCE